MDISKVAGFYGPRCIYVYVLVVEDDVRSPYTGCGNADVIDATEVVRVPRQQYISPGLRQNIRQSLNISLHLIDSSVGRPADLLLLQISDAAARHRRKLPIANNPSVSRLHCK